MVMPTRYLLQGLARGGAQNLQTISLSNVFVEPHSPIFIALGKGTLPFLKNMWLRYCGMDDDKVEFLASALLAWRTGKGLRSLHIQGDRNVGPRGCAALVDALIKGASPELQELDLSGTSVGDEGCRAVIWCLGGGWAACARTLRRLSLRDCEVTSRGMDVWLHGMTTMPLPLPALQTLDLGDNAHLGDPGLEHLVNGWV